MKKLTYYSVLILSLCGCSRNEEKANKNAQSAESPTAVPAKTLSIPYVVEYNEQTQKNELKHDAKDDFTNMSVEDMIKAVNLRYPKIQLELLKTDPDVVHVKINDAAYLSQAMGSSGAQIYMTESTYALTEVKGISSVEFIFQEGDHASPGLYTRESFKDGLEVK